MYWENAGPSRQTALRGEFERDKEIWRAEREASTIRWSREGEENLTPGFLPPSHNRHCFFLQLRDLVDPSGESTTDIASEIRRQMSGGFDLGKIRSGSFPSPSSRSKRQARKNYNAAVENVGRAEVAQIHLGKQVDQIDALETELKKAKAAAERLNQLARAIELAKRREKYAEISAQLAVMHSSLEKLTGKEREEVEQRQKKLNALEQGNRELETELEAARVIKEESRLSAVLDQADIAEWKDLANQLERVELEIQTATSEHDVSKKKLAAALHAVGGNQDETAAFNLPQHGVLMEFLRLSSSHTTRFAAIKERLRLLEDVESPSGSEQDLANLRAAAEALRTWLRTPQSEPQAWLTPDRRRWILLAIAILIAGIALAILVDPLLSYLAAVGAGVGLTVLRYGRTKVTGSRSQAARQSYEELELEQPTVWDVASVGSILRNVEGRLDELGASLTRTRDRGVEIKNLNNQLSELEEQKHDLDARRQELKSSLGLTELPPDAELVDFSLALNQLRQSCIEHEAAAGKLQGLKSDYCERLEKISGLLESHGELRPDGAAGVKARLNKLEQRNTKLQTALADERRVQDQLKKNTDDHEITLAEISGIYTELELEPDDFHGLVSMLESWPNYRELKSQAKTLKDQNELDQNALKSVGESKLASLDVHTLEQSREVLEQTAGQANELSSQITEIGVLAQQARRGNSTRDLIALREDARASLRDLRDEVLYTTGGAFLIDEIEREFETKRMPRVFERARSHFSAFTFHNYALRIDTANQPPRLFADDLRAGQRRDLDELSDGTRIQLLLAARMAFAEEVEQGEALPLFLDEALDQSDPQRFAAIVRSLASVAQNEGRQILYLTSDPFDVERIRNALDSEDGMLAEPIDLGLIRTGKAGEAQQFAVEDERPVPLPGAMTPAEYGAALGVPQLRPLQGFSGQHLFYVLWDDLELLHEFLTHHIERVGQWKTVAGTQLAERLGARSISEPEIGLRIDLLEVFCECWNQGRGKPVDADSLKDSGALSQNYLDGVAAMAGELHGDAEKLLAALRTRTDIRLRRFRTSSLEELQRYLADQGFLDERPILEENELRLQVLASPAANELPSQISNECLHKWWQWAGKSH
ncbi:MAG: hypothetical protein OXI17_05295 [Gammaproteobacteria bacterium]|nr:hypothetical protein [Gammaproteobacteria bacterium]